MRDEQLLAYLKGSCSGRKNRVGGTELEQTLHVSGTDLRKLVNQLRRKTHPIASDRSGYFYATTAGEEMCIRDRRNDVPVPILTTTACSLPERARPPTPTEGNSSTLMVFTP